MTEEEIRAATVRFTKMGGQGILIPGGIILTAAHCIEWYGDGRMVTGDTIIEDVLTRDGRTLRVEAKAVDPIADIAALLNLDDQTFPAESRQFNDYCNGTPAIPLSTIRHEPFLEFPIRILTHEGEWLRGQGQFCNTDGRSVSIMANAQIEGGTSGGPVVDEAGTLIGVVSFASVIVPPCTACEGSIAFACRALPVWLIEHLNKPAEE